VAHGSTGGNYLVVWADYNETRVHGRFVTGSGEVDGAPFPITEAPYGGLFPAVAYNATDDEFLVTWDDFGGRGEVIHGQRVRASDGVLLGANFAIGSAAGGIRSAVAWSGASNAYLVVYFVPGAVAEIRGQRVSGTGTLLGGNINVSADAVFSGYPAISWGEAGDLYLVTWDNEDGNIHGRRVVAATGAFAGSTILVTSGGGKDRSCVAYDPLEERWLVQYNDAANAGFSYDQYGRLVNVDGTLEGAAMPLAHSPAFEGDTQFGGDVAFAPGAGRFFSSFGTDTGMGARESSRAGEPIGPLITLGTGYFTSLNNAVDAARNRFLTVWEGLDGTFRVFGQLSAATLEPPRDFESEPGPSSNSLSWRNPDDPHFTRTIIRFRTDGYPEGPGDGELAADRTGTPGSTDGFVHAGLTDWTTYYYSAFACDAAPNCSPAARAAGTPRPAATTIYSSDFDAGADGWTLLPWRAGTLSPGTIAWDPAGRNLVSTGSGATNNRDTCTREGGILTRAISTAGHSGIQIEYDVMASLQAPPGPSAPGSCAVLEGGVEDKLVVSYSVAGTNGPWSAVQVLTEGIELPAPWTRKLINLAGIPGADDNPAFALRFQWQFNHERDTSRIEAIRLLSGAVTGLAPAIAVSTERFEHTLQMGDGLPGDSFFVANSGEGILDFDVTDDVPWLTTSPAAGATAGPGRRVTITYDAAGLPEGDHEGTVEIGATADPGSPRTVAVLLHVVPRACLRDPFAYYDGELTTMGSPGWSGNATGQVLVEKGALRVFGGAGTVSAVRPVACTAGDASTVRIKIQKGAGTGDFFWNIAIDDDSGDSSNLARWYGGSGIARGRIGGAITGDMALSGPDVWDDLRVTIDASASEFFFNGVSYGTIAHGSGSGRIGAIRIERLDRVGTGGDSIRFDDLVIEDAPRRPFHRADPDSSGSTNVTDAIALLGFLFRGGSVPACAESADANNDGQIDVSDALAILLHLFGGRPIPPPGPPGSACGTDPDPPSSAGDLGCGVYEPCAPGG
jgi:hypothetical protein